MFNSNVLDVAIGLVFVFLLLSLVCSALNEIIEGFIKQRAAHLESGIKELVGEVGKPDSQAFIEKLYNHSLINSLYKGKYGGTGNDKATLPSYIPSANFALAVLDLRNTGVNLPANVKGALDTFVNLAGTDAARLQQYVEDWYDSAMDRVSGWYKRHCQRILLVLGLATTVLVNADCIQLGQRLFTDSSLRTTMAQLASEQVKQNVPLAGSDVAASTQLVTNLKSLDGIGLPIGWPEVGWEWNSIWMHLLGWLLTAFAVSLGAPFWFDVLSKFMAVRSALKPADQPKAAA
jgi:hypothetical protein